MLAGTLWLAVILVDGDPVGAIDIHNIALDKTHGEIGYWIAERFQGQGIMTKALEKVVAIGFQELGLHRLNLLTDVDNQKSQRVAQKAGFVQEARLKEYLKTATGFNDAFMFAKINPR